MLTIPTKLKLYNTCILPIFLYGSECWAITKRDVRNQMVPPCVEWMMTTKQTYLSAIVQARHFSLFGHIVWMPDETDANKILTVSNFIKIIWGVLELWWVENRPFPITLAVGLCNSLYQHTSRDVDGSMKALLGRHFVGQVSNNNAQTLNEW